MMKKILLLTLVLCFATVVSATPAPNYYWSFDTDASGDIGGIDGIAAGDAQHITSTDMVGGGYYNFSGAGEVALQLDYDNSANNNKEFSVSVWVRPSEFDGAQTIIQNAQETIGLVGYKMNLVSGQVQFSFGNDVPIEVCTASSPSPLEVGNLYNIVAVWDKDPNPQLFQDYLKLYINGSLVTNQYCGNHFLTFAADDVCHIVGREAYGTGCTNRDSGETKGGIDEYKIWYDYVLSESEIEEEYLSGFCTPNWTCSGYDACNSSDLQVCNAVTEQNTCGEAYSGDYTEFTPLVCDYCTPDWDCSGYGLCVNSTQSCDEVADNNLCSEAYSGNYSEFPDQACVEQYSPNYNSGDLVAIAGDGLGTAGATFVELLPVLIIGLLLFAGYGYYKLAVKKK